MNNVNTSKIYLFNLIIGQETIVICSCAKNRQEAKEKCLNHIGKYMVEYIGEREDKIRGKTAKIFIMDEFIPQEETN